VLDLKNICTNQEIFQSIMQIEGTLFCDHEAENRFNPVFTLSMNIGVRGVILLNQGTFVSELTIYFKTG